MRLERIFSSGTIRSRRMSRNSSNLDVARRDAFDYMKSICDASIWSLLEAYRGISPPPGRSRLTRLGHSQEATAFVEQEATAFVENPLVPAISGDGSASHGAEEDCFSRHALAAGVKLLEKRCETSRQWFVVPRKETQLRSLFVPGN
jgi:hypothetical protein